jgi:hypothetical protein
MTTAVKEILKRIEGLSEEDRLVLQRRLADWNEAEWQQEAKKARKRARAAKLTQRDIDNAIERTRYGR